MSHSVFIMKASLFIGLLLYSVNSVSAQGQSMLFTFTDSTTASFPLSSIQKVTFSESALILNLKNGTTEQWNLNTIAKYSYESSSGLLPLTGNNPVQALNLYPNPSSGEINFEYELPAKSNAGLYIYSMQGALLRTIYQGHQTKGKQEIKWNNQTDKNGPLPSGIYLCRLQSENKNCKKYIVLQ
ncbi:MAG: T9SS type A sorting domain-containing protein [Bacteroidia bacterium]|nr:T9SS type A sorting domain-containing protein [Bacteroidia bacterium]